MAVCIKSISTCKGEFPSRRSSCVSVSTLLGMRLRITILRGRISWCMARFSVMTKTFSDSRILAAGRLSEILIGIERPHFCYRHRFISITKIWDGFNRKWRKRTAMHQLRGGIGKEKRKNEYKSYFYSPILTMKKYSY